MKERFLLRCIASITLIFALTACSDASKKMSDLLEHVPSDAEGVFVANVRTIVESSGGTIEESRLRLPSYLEDMMGRSDTEFISFIEDSGVDMDAIALFGDFDESYSVILFSLQDKDKFIDAIEDEKFREKDVDDGVSYYVKEDDRSYGTYYDYIAIIGDYAYYIENVWGESDFNAKRKLRRSIEAADKESFAETGFYGFVTQGNLAGGYLKIPGEAKREFRRAGLGSEIEDLLDGVVCMNSNITDNALNVRFKLLDANGDEMDTSEIYKHFDSNAKINPAALAYLGNNDILVYGISMKDYDWDYYFDQFGNAAGMSRSDMAVMAIVKSYLEKFDGTLVIGAGLANGKESIYKLGLDNEKDVMGEISFTMVMETKSGKAKGIINDIRALLDSQGLYYENDRDGLALKFPDWNASIYVKADNDMVIVSNSDIDARDGNATVDNIKFENYFAAAGLVLSKQDKLAEDFNLDEGLKTLLTYDLTTLEASLDFIVEGDGSKGLIETIADAIIDDIQPEAERISERWIEYYDSRYDSAIEAVPYDSSDEYYSVEESSDSVAVAE